jgi:hypothetical protein
MLTIGACGSVSPRFLKRASPQRFFSYLLRISYKYLSSKRPPPLFPILLLELIPLLRAFNPPPIFLELMEFYMVWDMELGFYDFGKRAYVSGLLLLLWLIDGLHSM